MKKENDLNDLFTIIIVSVFVLFACMAVISEHKNKTPHKVQTAFTWIEINGVETIIK